MKYLFVSLLSLLSIAVNAQELNKKVEDKIRHQQILLNKCSRAGLVSFPGFKASYEVNYENYKTDSTAIPELAKLIKGKKIKIVLGTWCSDSKFQVPHFLKITDTLGIKEKDIEFIAVDGAKKTENGLTDELDIQRVPTFVVTDKKGKEIGRIVEHPQKSLELDLIEILTPKE